MDVVERPRGQSLELRLIQTNRGCRHARALSEIGSRVDARTGIVWVLHRVASIRSRSPGSLQCTPGTGDPAR